MQRLFPSRSVSLLINSSYGAWIFYCFSRNKVTLSTWFLLLSQYSQTWGFGEKKKKKELQVLALSHPGFPVWLQALRLHMQWEVRSSYWALQQWRCWSQDPAQEREPCWEQSYSANASVGFMHSASLYRKGLPRSTWLLKWTKTWKNFPLAMQYRQNQSDPSQPGLLSSEECAVFCHIVWTNLFQELCRGGRDSY